jgi:hypothetical protein
MPYAPSGSNRNKTNQTRMEIKEIIPELITQYQIHINVKLHSYIAAVMDWPIVESITDSLVYL